MTYDLLSSLNRYCCKPDVGFTCTACERGTGEWVHGSGPFMIWGLFGRELYCAEFSSVCDGRDGGALSAYGSILFGYWEECVDDESRYYWYR